VFVTSQGHAYSRFRRALLSKNVALVDAAARELERIGLEDALRILVVLAERGDRRFDHAAARFAGRVSTERRLGLAEARYVLALAEALPRSPDSIARVRHVGDPTGQLHEARAVLGLTVDYYRQFRRFGDQLADRESPARQGESGRPRDAARTLISVIVPPSRGDQRHCEELGTRAVRI
jgi:hypothetical protein